jgi:hypothetical protein
MDDLLLALGDRVEWLGHTNTEGPPGLLGTVISARLGGPYHTASYEVRWDDGNVVGYGNGHIHCPAVGPSVRRIAPQGECAMPVSGD